VICQF